MFWETSNYVNSIFPRTGRPWLGIVWLPKHFLRFMTWMVWTFDQIRHFTSAFFNFLKFSSSDFFSPNKSKHNRQWSFIQKDTYIFSPNKSKHNRQWSFIQKDTYIFEIHGNPLGTSFLPEAYRIDVEARQILSKWNQYCVWCLIWSGCWS